MFGPSSHDPKAGISRVSRELLGQREELATVALVSRGRGSRQAKARDTCSLAHVLNRNPVMRANRQTASLVIGSAGASSSS